MEEERREQFRRMVIKDDTSRLRAEIRRARPHMTEEETDDLTREELVEIITDLRLRTGETSSIKESVSEIIEGAVVGTVPEVIRPVETVVHVDPVQAMMQMVLIMKREDVGKEAWRIEQGRWCAEMDRVRAEQR